MTTHAKTLCPSAQHDAEEAQIFAVVGGTPTRPRAAYLDHAQPITDDLVNLTGSVAPAEVFRIAAPCAGSGCGHFDDVKHQCRLVTKTVRLRPVVVSQLPRCAIRSACRWWQQEGASACRRCPQIVTNNYAPDEATRSAADVTNIPQDGHTVMHPIV